MGRYKVEGKSVGKTTEPEFNETFNLRTQPEKPTFTIEIVDKHLINDRQIGIASVIIGQHIHPEKNENSSKCPIFLKRINFLSIINR